MRVKKASEHNDNQPVESATERFVRARLNNLVKKSWHLKTICGAFMVQIAKQNSSST